jgi:formiminotetrahydrofolate cyclodeaminase
MPTIKNYLDALGADTVSPGGGSAAALAAALGTALVRMTAGLNIKRELKKTGKIDGRARRRLLALKKIVSQFVRLMEEDARAFNKISRFLKRGQKGSAAQRALKEGIRVPLEICGLAERASAMGTLEISRTSRWLASDLAEGGVLLASAFQSARLNADINLRAVSDRGYAKKATRQLNRLQKKVQSHRSKLLGALR